MAASTEMARLDSLPKETLDALLGLLDYGTVPAAKTADNGKILMVVGGKWKAVELPVELPAVTAEDDGAVLTVVDGAWAAAQAGE